MTDTPGWASPSSSGPGPEDSRPASAAPSGADGVNGAPAAGQTSVPGPAQPTDSIPGSTPGSVPPPYTGAPPYTGVPYGSAPPAGAPYGGPQAPPPPQGWGAPQQPGWGQPQPGWGQPGWGQPGWGQQPQQPGSPFSGWGAPQSPKPGVIPLRPLGVGEILDGAITTTRKYWRTVLGLSLMVAVLVNTAVAVVTWLAEHNQDTSFAISMGVIVTGAITALLGLVAGLLLTALLTVVVSKAILGEPVSLAGAWHAARPQLWRLLGLTMLVGLIVTAIAAAGIVPLIAMAAANTSGAIAFVVGVPVLLAGLGLALWTGVRLSLAAPALMLEKQGIRAAMGRSRRLVRGSWWRIFGITVLGYVLTGLFGAILKTPFNLLGVAVGGVGTSGPFGVSSSATQSLAALVVITIGSIIASLLTYPLQAGINVLLYVDQRIRREALDLELARAAGLPEYGGTGWAGHPMPPAGV